MYQNQTPGIGTAIHKFKLDSLGKFYIDDDLIYESEGSLSQYFNMYIFTFNNNNTPFFDVNNISKVYDVKIWKNDILTMHLIPMLDVNGVPCMYDEISEQNFYNNGTGNFSFN